MTCPDDLTQAQREVATQATMEAIRLGEETVPAVYPRSRALTVVCALWDIGWRPQVEGLPETETETETEHSAVIDLEGLSQVLRAPTAARFVADRLFDQAPTVANSSADDADDLRREALQTARTAITAVLDLVAGSQPVTEPTTRRSPDDQHTV